MKRISVHETAGGRGRFTGADDISTTDKENDTMGTIEEQFIAEADERAALTARQLAGDFSVPKRAGDIDLTVGDSVTPGLTGRDAYLARELAMSRAPAPGAGSGARVSADDLEVDDDDSTTSATGSARDANLDRELRRSREPARGVK